MKYTSIWRLLPVVLFALLASSCVSNKKMIYLQGAATHYAEPVAIDKTYELRVKADDQLAISVASRYADLLLPFNNKVLIGTSLTSSSYSQQYGTSYFLVDKDGQIDFPVFGKITVLGKTTQEVSKLLQQRFVSDGGISDAVVNTRIMNFKVTVMGDVSKPGTFNCSNERLTLMEALGMSGDLNNSAYRQPVLIYREVNGERVAYEVDLCDESSVFNSPAYYLQQNDVIYVKPNKSQRLKGSLGYTWLSIGSTVLGMMMSIASLIISLSK